MVKTHNISRHNRENEQVYYRTKVSFNFNYSRESERGQVTFFSLAHIHPTPGWDPLGRCRIAAGQQNRKLVGLKGLGGCRDTVRPPREPTLREPLLA